MSHGLLLVMERTNTSFGSERLFWQYASTSELHWTLSIASFTVTIKNKLSGKRRPACAGRHNFKLIGQFLQARRSTIVYQEATENIVVPFGSAKRIQYIQWGIMATARMFAFRLPRSTSVSLYTRTGAERVWHPIEVRQRSDLIFIRFILVPTIASNTF